MKYINDENAKNIPFADFAPSHLKPTPKSGSSVYPSKKRPP